VAERDNAAISFKLPELRAGVNALALGPIATPQLEAFFLRGMATVIQQTTRLLREAEV
jgi:hypothetical protein